MTAIGEVISIGKDVALILASFSALFYVYRTKKAEKIRREYDTITDCFVYFSKIASAIYDWTSFIQYLPLDENGQPIKDAPEKNLQKQLEKLYPRAYDAFLKAKLLLDQDAIGTMENFFATVRQGMADHRSSQIFFKGMDDIREADTPELHAAYHDYKEKAFAYEKAAKERMPKEIKELLTKLEGQLRNTIHSWR